MSRTLIQRLSQSRMWLIGLSSVALFSTGTMFKDLSTKYKTSGGIQNGLQICANRVHQTFTASVIGDTSSIYMDSGFTGSSEECFAEASSMMEDFKGLSAATIKRMNALNSDVHWFHEALRSTGKGFSVTDVDKTQNLEVKYQKVEQGVEAVAQLFQAHSETLDKSMSNLKFALALAAFVLFGAGALQITSSRRRASDKKEIEDEAYGELISEDTCTATKVEEILVSALELNEMTHCSKLLTTYRQNVLKTIDSNSIFKASEKPVASTPMAMLLDDDLQSIEDTAQKVWDKSKEEEQTYVTTEIEPLASKIVDYLSNKLIAEGIIVDMSVNESLIRAESESLEQVLYYVLQDALRNTENSNEKLISIRGKTLGSVYNFEVVSKGLGKEGADSTSLEIAKELLSENSGRLEIANSYGEDKETNGRKIRIILKSSHHKITRDEKSQTLQEQIEAEVMAENEAQKKEKTVRRVERGTKKEILERMHS